MDGHGEHDDVARGEDAGGRDARGGAIGEAIAGAARRGGLALVADGRTPGGRDLLRAMGGVRGIAEAVLPGLAFLVLFAFTRSLPLSLGVSVGVAVVFTLVRVVRRSAPTQAIAGLLGAVASAALALLTGRGEDNFLLGLITNGAYGAAMLVSLLVGWPLLGLAIGFLMGDGTAWRRERSKLRAMQWLTLCWLALFVARLAVQLPLYLSADLADNVELLAAAKLLMGIPLYVPLLLLTWLVTRSVYGARQDAGGEGPGDAARA